MTTLTCIYLSPITITYLLPPSIHCNSSTVQVGETVEKGAHTPVYTLTYYTNLSLPTPSTMQAVFNVTKTRYPLKDEDYHALAGIQAATFAAEHPDEGLTSATSLRPFLSRFYPSHLLQTAAPIGMKSIGKLFKQTRGVVEGQQSGLEEKLKEEFESMVGRATSAHNLKVLYLQYCWSKPFYG